MLLSYYFYCVAVLNAEKKGMLYPSDLKGARFIYI